MMKKPPPDDSKEFGKFTPLSEVKIQKIDWLWKGYFALGTVIGLEGDPGFGKSLMIADLISRITTGRPWPDGSSSGEIGNVVYFSAEDDVARTVKPRIIAAGGDENRISTASSVIKNEAGDKEHFIALPDDYPLMKRALQKVSNLKMIVFDPIDQYYSMSLDAKSSHQVRKVFSVLKELAEQLRIQVITIRHLNKNSKETSALYRGSGSMAFVAAARIAYLLAPNPNEELDFNEAPRILAQLKNNLDMKAPSLSFTIHGVANVIPDFPEVVVPKIEWNSAAIELTANDLLIAPSENSASKRQAEIFLNKELNSTWRLAKDVLDLGLMRGITQSSIHRAGKKINMERRLVRIGKISAWVWWLPIVCGVKFDPAKDLGVARAIRKFPQEEEKY